MHHRLKKSIMMRKLQKLFVPTSITSHRQGKAFKLHLVISSFVDLSSQGYNVGQSNIALINILIVSARRIEPLQTYRIQEFKQMIVNFGSTFSITAGATHNLIVNQESKFVSKFSVSFI